MDVRRAPGIGDRPDGAEAIGAVVADRPLAVTLEVGIGPAAAVARVVVAAGGVALPDLHAQARQRPAGLVQHPAEDVGHLARRRLWPAVDGDQVAVGIERDRRRIERSGGLPRRRGQGRRAERPRAQGGERQPGGDESAAAKAKGSGHEVLHRGRRHPSTARGHVVSHARDRMNPWPRPGLYR